jgi:hypothetical protein
MCPYLPRLDSPKRNKALGKKPKGIVMLMAAVEPRFG